MAKPFLGTTTETMTEFSGPVTGNVLLAASDADGDTLTVARIDGLYLDETGKKGGITFSGTYGVLTIYSNGDYSYALNAGVDVPTGSTFIDDFSVKIRDGSGLFASNQLIIEIAGVPNTKPTAVDDLVNLGTGTAIIGNVLTNDTDAEGDALHVSAVGLGKSTTEHISGLGDNTTLVGVYGSLSINDSGDFVYLLNKSDPDYIALGGAGGVEHFSYKVGDGQEKPNMDFGYLDITFS